MPGITGLAAECNFYANVVYKKETMRPLRYRMLLNKVARQSRGLIYSGLVAFYLPDGSDVKDAEHPKGKSLTSGHRQIFFS